MTSAAAQDRSRVLPSSTRFLIAMVSPLVEGPMMAKTFFSSMSCLAKETAFSGRAPVSLMIRSTCLPWMPRLAFRFSTIMRRVLASGAPRNEAGPVSARSAPILMESSACAGATKSDTRAGTTVRVLRMRFRVFISSSLSCRGCRPRRSLHNKQGVSVVGYSLKRTASAGLFLEDDELAVLHGQHLEGIDVEAVVVRGGEVEDARGAHESLDVLDGRTHLLLVRAGAGILEPP